MKFILIFVMTLLLNNCSLNKDSKFWTEDVVKRFKDAQESYKIDIKR